MALVADERSTQWFSPAPGEEQSQANVDTGVAHIARVYNYWLGGKDNFAADQRGGRGGDHVLSHRANQRGPRSGSSCRQAVSYLAGEAGIRQFLDIGTGLPSASNTHEVAQQAAPQSRIVYVDNDPIVLRTLAPCWRAARRARPLI